MPIRVFLSSKMKEFESERAAIAHQVSTLRGFQINPAEEWGALSANVEKVYRGGVRECHIYVGLFGRIYSAATQHEYEEACLNPYRQKLIYLRQARNVDPQLMDLIDTLKHRHRPYVFKNLWDLQPQLLLDLEYALEEIANQNLERGDSRPVVQTGSGPSVSEEAWRNTQEYLSDLYGHDGDLTVEYLAAIRESIQTSPRSGT